MAHFLRQFSYMELIGGLADMPSVLEAPKRKMQQSKLRCYSKTKQGIRNTGRIRQGKF